MNILGYSTQNSGCSYHRVVLPLAFMDDIKAFATDMPSDEKLAEGWDLILYNRISCFDSDWDRTKKELNCKIVMDIDDDWELPPSHIAYQEYADMKDRIINNLQSADLVTTTNQKLLDKICPINSNVQLFPNALPYGLDQFTDEKVEDEAIRIFWCGSVTHEKDIRILYYPFQRMINHTNIKMMLGGYNSSNQASLNIWNRMLKSFTYDLKLPFQVINAADPMSYMGMYNYADISVIPLESGTWHSYKSNLKILESAAKKVPCIVSKVEPYSRDSDAPVLWVEKQTDWYKHLKFLIKNKNAREDYGQKVYEWAKERYNFATINAGRKATFESLIKS